MRNHPDGVLFSRSLQFTERWKLWIEEFKDINLARGTCGCSRFQIFSLSVMLDHSTVYSTSYKRDLLNEVFNPNPGGKNNKGLLWRFKAKRLLASSNHCRRGLVDLAIFYDWKMISKYLWM